MTLFRVIIIFAILSFLSSCKLAKMGGDARENPPDPKLRVKKNLEEGKAFRLKDIASSGRGGNFEFASSNELWRASLDTIDFIPLTSVNYSGGLIITDWYSDGNNLDESLDFDGKWGLSSLGGRSQVSNLTDNGAVTSCLLYTSPSPRDS